MLRIFFWGFLSVHIFAHSFSLTTEEAEFIAAKIYQNECGSQSDKLVWWNAGEEFASCGIGHFIWYPEGKKGPFEETFPALLAYLQERGTPLPSWLKGPCPWASREEFLSDKSSKKKELTALLASSIPLQAAFLARHNEQLMARIPYEEKIAQLAATAQGKYALLDYLNFKGAGLSESERYQGQGWGLAQVLAEMNGGNKDPVKAFSAAAQAILEKRVKNAPPERREERWLPGWTSRIKTYSL